MKSAKNKATTISFFTDIPLEFGGGAELMTIETAKAFANKKGFNVVVYTFKKNPLKVGRNPFQRIKYLAYGKKTLEDALRYSPQEIRAKLGKAEYKKFPFWKVVSALTKSDYIFVRSDIPSLLPIFFAVLKNRGLRKRLLIQGYTPLRYIQPTTFLDRFHNLVYTTFIYKTIVKILTKHFQSLNIADKKIIKGSSLVKLPCEEIFFSSQKANISIPKKRTVILSSRLTGQKGIDMLPELFSYLKKKKSLENFKFIIAGTGDLEPVVKKIQKKYKHVQYVQHVDHNAMPELLQKGTIFLMLSRYEGSPVALAEAMAMGLIIVSFKIPGIYSKKTKDIIFFAEPFHISDLGRKLISVASMSNEDIKKKSEENIAYAKKEYKLENYIKKLENILLS